MVSINSASEEALKLLLGIGTRDKYHVSINSASEEALKPLL